MKITAQQYISNSKEGESFVKVFRHFFSSTDKKVNKQGDIYALLNISFQKGVNAERISKFVWDSVVDGYLYSTSSTTNESLKDAIEEGVKKVKELMANDTELEKVGIDISFTIVLVKDEGVYVGIFGENDIYTYKEGSFVNVSEILKEKRANTAGIALGNNDVLMISSSGLLTKSVSRLSVLTAKKEYMKMLDAIGENLEGSKALLYFVEGVDERAEVKQKKTIIPIEKVRSSAEKILKPMARVEKLKENDTTKKEKGLDSIKEKVNYEENMAKAKNMYEKISKKISVIFKKIGDLLGSKWEIIKEKIVQNLGKKRWYKKIASRFSQMSIGRRRPVGVTGMRIDDYKVRDLRGRRFKILATFVVVIVLLTLGINFTIKMRHAREISKLANDGFVEVEDLLKKSEDSFVSDRASAETFLFQAEKRLDEIPQDLSEKDMEKYLLLEERALGIGDSLYRRVGFTDKNGLSNFVDSRLSFGEGSNVVDMATYLDNSGNEYLVVADRGRKAVYRVSLYDKSVMALPDNDGLVTMPEHVYVGTKGVYVYDTREGMLKASFDEESWFGSFAILSGLGVGDVKSSNIAEMTVWTLSDNIYFMSTDRKSLLKSTPAYGDRYGLAYAYLNDDRFESATDMIADLSIYVTVPEDPHIIRFNYSFFESKYVEAPLGVLNFDGDYGKLDKAFTGDSLDYGLYFFDSAGRRLLRFEKPIESGVDARHPNQISLLNQYVYRGEKDSVLADVKNFVIDSKESSAYILDGSVIWKLGL